MVLMLMILQQRVVERGLIVEVHTVVHVTVIHLENIIA